MKHVLLYILVVICFFSCKEENAADLAVNQHKVDVVIERFDQQFAKTNEKSLPDIKRAYPFFFPKDVNDTEWIEKINDTLQQELAQEVSRVFPDFEIYESDVELLFSYIHYYFPTFKTPRVITTTSNVEYRNKVIVTDTIVLLALDTYLGRDHYFYEGIPRYIAEHLDKQEIVVDLAGEYAKKYIFQPKRKSLLDEMIYYGKVLYFKDKVLPFKKENERISYTAEQLDWTRNNESSIWRYFVERELLFSTDAKLPNRFINAAPFSKFQLEGIDSESPGRIGQYIGWQIVKAYMENNDTPFKDMLIMDAEDIFNNSKFKPKKNNG